MYRMLFYVNIYGSFKLSKNSSVFLAHPVLVKQNLRKSYKFSSVFHNLDDDL